MRNGDISNETPPRIIVNIEVVLNSELIEKKFLLMPATYSRKVLSLKNAQLSHLWTLANKYGLSVELCAFTNDGWNQKDLDGLMNRLDNRGGNPFNYAELYDTMEDFISELPYRTNLKGVVDINGRTARYGSWGIELNNL